MIKSILCAAALAAIAPAALAQTAPAQDPAGQTAPAASTTPTIDSPIKDLLAHPGAAAVMEKHLPGVAAHPMRSQFEGMTLGEVAPMSQGAITPETIAAIDTDLQALPES